LKSSRDNKASIFRTESCVLLLLSLLFNRFDSLSQMAPHRQPSMTANGGTGHKQRRNYG
jgi:hypothetical protein